MIIIQSRWMGKANFSLIPVTLDCPYVEAIFDPESKNLVVFNKCSQTRFRMFPKLNEQGDTAALKRPRQNGVTYPEERKQMESFVEHYIENPDDIRGFIKRFVVNPEAVDIEKFLTASESAPVLNKVE